MTESTRQTARSALLAPLAELAPLLAVPTMETLRLADLARSLAADVEAELRPGAAASPYIAHNLAALLLALVDLDAQDERVAALARAAAPLLLADADADPEDLAIPAALLAAGALLPDKVPELLARGARAAASPLAGDRLLGAWSRWLVHVATGKDDAARGLVLQQLPAAVAQLDRSLEQRPYQPAVAEVRLRLLVVDAHEAEGPARDAALTRFQLLATDYEDRFGRSRGLSGIRLEAALLRAQVKGASEAVRREARELLLDLAPPGGLTDGELVRAVRAADRANVLRPADHKALVEPLRSRSATARPSDRAPLHKALLRSLERAGERDALLDALAADVVRQPKNRDLASSLVQTVLSVLAKGEEPQVPAQALRIAADGAGRGSFAKLDSEGFDRWIDLLVARLGAEEAAGHIERQLVQVRELRKLQHMWERGATLLREAGRPDAALDLLREAWDKGKHDPLRLAYARALVEAERDLPDAEEAVRPLVGTPGPHQAEAKALRDSIVGHPALEAQRRQQLLDFEDEVGVGGDRPLRLRVLFTGDGFALTEVVEHPAPPAYEHKHLRVLVRRGDLPGDLDVADLRKGRDVFARVRGDDDTRRKGGLRVYWVAEGTTVDPGWSAEERLRRVAELEARFRINSGASLPLRVRKVVPRRQAAWASIEAPVGAGRETFPSDVRIINGDLPEGTTLGDLREGDVLYAPVDSIDAGGGDPGDRRYRVRPPVEVAPRDERKGGGRG